MKSNKLILIVDDEEAIVFSLQRILELSGTYEVLTATSGEQALKEIKQTVPDLIISDIKMPGMDGLELCKKIRSNEVTTNIPFIFLTAKRELMIEGFKAGGDDFIIKPFTFDEVMAKIEAMFRRIQKTQEQANQIKGDLKEYGLDQILKICAKKSITGTLILQKKGQIGEIELERGDISGISFKDLEENAALDELRSWESGIFIIRPVGIKLRPEFLAAYSRKNIAYKLDEAVEIGTDTWWVGHRNPKTLMQQNVYLRSFRKDDKAINFLIDPGAPADFPIISKKISTVSGSLSKVHLYSLSSPTPDVCMNTIYLRNTNNKAICLTSEENWAQILHYEIHPKSVKLINSFNENTAPFATGHKIQFIATPYCPYFGSFMIYDPDTRILFSGSLFSGLDSHDGQPRLYAKEDDWDGIRAYHQTYMPSGKALRLALEKINALEPTPLLIAPQHGMILRGSMLDDVLQRLNFLETGAELLLRDERETDPQLYIEAGNAFLRECSSYIPLDQISWKINKDTFLQSGASFRNNEIINIFNNPMDVFEQLVITVTEGEEAQLISQLKSYALKLMHTRGLPVPHFAWDADPTITTTPAKLFSEEDESGEEV